MIQVHQIYVSAINNATDEHDLNHLQEIVLNDDATNQSNMLSAYFRNAFSSYMFQKQVQLQRHRRFRPNI